MPWVRELEKDFDQREARRRRRRNALVRGGRWAAKTVKSVVEFAEALAVSAIALAIEGRLGPADAVDFFLDRQANLAGFHARLNRGEPLSVVLFWEDDGQA